MDKIHSPTLNPTCPTGHKTTEEIMVLCSIHPRTRAFIAASALLGALLLTLPFTAMAQQDKPKAESEKTKHYQPVTPDQIEKHIAHLHDQLQITAPEEVVWKDFAQVMRDNSTRMNALIEKWSQEKGQKNAVENLKAHAEMAEEHAQAMRKLVPALETLYNSMSPEQKKGADMVFNHGKHQEHHKGKNL